MPVAYRRAMSSRTALVVNAASRSGARGFDLARTTLLGLGVDLGVTPAVSDPSTLRKVIGDVLEQDYGTVVVGPRCTTASRSTWTG